MLNHITNLIKALNDTYEQNALQYTEFVANLVDARAEGLLIAIIGNGGSAATSSHFAADLAKNTRNLNCTCGHPMAWHKFYNPVRVELRSCNGCSCQWYVRDGERPFRIVCLNDNTSIMTAFANDEGYHEVFRGQLPSIQPNILIAISGSGSSPNILTAVEWANSNNVFTIGLTGFKGGHLAGMAKCHINVPSDDYGVIEDVHSAVLHGVVGEFQS